MEARLECDQIQMLHEKLLKSRRKHRYGCGYVERQDPLRISLSWFWWLGKILNYMYLWIHSVLSHSGSDPMSHEPETDLFEEPGRQYEEPALGKERFGWFLWSPQSEVISLCHVSKACLIEFIPWGGNLNQIPAGYYELLRTYMYTSGTGLFMVLYAFSHTFLTDPNT